MKSPYSPPYPPHPPRTDRSGYHAAADYDEYPDDYDTQADYEDYDGYGGYRAAADTYDDEPLDRRWIWVAGVAGVVLLVAVVCTSVILGGGDSGSVSATVVEPSTTSQPTTTRAPAATSTPVAPPPAALPPETVTTVTPSPSASAEPTPTPAPPPAAAVPAPDPRTVTYHVTGSRQFIDLVTVIYTDQQGALQTDLNVALPWTKTIVLDPGVELSSVTATSVTGQLNCAITDAAGATVVAQSNNTIIATCTK